MREHMQTARDFLEVADREFAAGDTLQASEKLWGAASHAVIALCQQRDWPFGKHRNLKSAVQSLYAETGEEILRGGFSTAEKFHANYYHDFMEDFQVDEYRPAVHDFVARTLALLEETA